MDQPRKVAKPARGQLNREIKCSCRCIRGKYNFVHIYVLLFEFVYILYQVYFCDQSELLIYKGHNFFSGV